MPKELPARYLLGQWQSTSTADGHTCLTSYHGKSIGIYFLVGGTPVLIKLGHWQVEKLVKSLLGFLQSELRPIPPKGYSFISEPSKVSEGVVLHGDKCWNGCAWWNIGKNSDYIGDKFSDVGYYCRKGAKG
jgi:hypothetical protein